MRPRAYWLWAVELPAPGNNVFRRSNDPRTTSRWTVHYFSNRIVYSQFVPVIFEPPCTYLSTRMVYKSIYLLQHPERIHSWHTYFRSRIIKANIPISVAGQHTSRYRPKDIKWTTNQKWHETISLEQTNPSLIMLRYFALNSKLIIKTDDYLFLPPTSSVKMAKLLGTKWSPLAHISISRSNLLFCGHSSVLCTWHPPLTRLAGPVGWIYLAQDRDWWRVLVYTVTNLRVP
jgi:hypothetical protein